MQKVIDSKHGRAGYTLIHNSYGLVLSANQPFDSKASAIREEKDVEYEIMINETETERKTVADTDKGKEIQKEIEELRMLLEAYRNGTIKQEIWA